MMVPWFSLQIFFFLPGMTLKTITVNYPLQKNISEISTTVSMSSSVIKQSPMTLGLWSRYQIGWIIFRYWTFICSLLLLFILPRRHIIYLWKNLYGALNKKTVPCLVWTWLRQRFQVSCFPGLHSRFKTSLGHTAWSLKCWKVKIGWVKR